MASKKPIAVYSGVQKEIQTGDTIPIGNGGTGATTANDALNALLPSQTGNSGKVLGTNGTTSSWVAAAAGVTDGDKGDITVSGSGGTWTIDNDAVTYEKFQNIATNQRVLGRTSGANGNAQELTASQVLDWIGSSQGNILYRGASGWAALATSTSGYFLRTNGTSQDPSWSNNGYGLRMFFALQTGISAAGTTSANATVLGADTHFVNVTTVSSGTGIRFNYCFNGWPIFVKNNGANALLVYPVTGGTINALGTNVALSIAAGATQIFIATSSTNYQSLL